MPGAAGATRLMAIRPPQLIVVAPTDAAVAAELRLHAETLLEAFAAAPGGSAPRTSSRTVVGGRPSGLASRRPR